MDTPTETIQTNGTAEPIPPPQQRPTSGVDAILRYRAAAGVAAGARSRAEVEYAKAFLASQQKTEEARKQEAKGLSAKSRLDAELADVEAKTAEMLARWMTGIDGANRS